MKSIPHRNNNLIRTEPRIQQQIQVSGGDSSITSSVEEQPRQRKRPAWMMDYVSGDDLSNYHPIAHFT